MKIYKLSTNRVHEPLGPMISSYNAPREEKKVEYYATKEKAEEKQSVLYTAAAQMFGLNNGYEFRITEVEVIE